MKAGLPAGSVQVFCGYLCCKVCAGCSDCIRCCLGRLQDLEL